MNSFPNSSTQQKEGCLKLWQISLIRHGEINVSKGNEFLSVKPENITDYSKRTLRPISGQFLTTFLKKYSCF
jgi:hypothetical protein